MKKLTEKTGASVLTLAGILLASTQSFGEANPHSVQVCVGYADTLHSPGFTPSPWLGSPGVIFIGIITNQYDAGAIKLYNSSNQPLRVDSVTVDIGPTLGINPWSPATPFTIPAKGTAILTQTGFFNFNTSEIPSAITCTNDGFIPVVHVTVGTNKITKDFTDTGQVLNTGGIHNNSSQGNSEGHAFVPLQGAPPANREIGSNGGLA